MEEHDKRLKGLRVGWELAKNKKLPPKPCLICGKDVFYKKSTANRAKYCSVKCRKKGVADTLRGRQGKKKGEYLNCETCGKKFYRAQSEIKRGKHKCCSFTCRKKSQYSTCLKGAESPNWKGGIQKIRGYIYVKSYNHPNRNMGDYVAQHRLVMEKHIGRYLLKSESVHHKNGVKDDNRIDNLELVGSSPHVGYITCPHCRKEFLIR